MTYFFIKDLAIQPRNHLRRFRGSFSIARNLGRFMGTPICRNMRPLQVIIYDRNLTFKTTLGSYIELYMDFGSKAENPVIMTRL
jgi:hypothetical protein